MTFISLFVPNTTCKVQMRPDSHSLSSAVKKDINSRKSYIFLLQSASTFFQKTTLLKFIHQFMKIENDLLILTSREMRQTLNLRNCKVINFSSILLFCYVILIYYLHCNNEILQLKFHISIVTIICNWYPTVERLRGFFSVTIPPVQCSLAIAALCKYTCAGVCVCV